MTMKPNSRKRQVYQRLQDKGAAAAIDLAVELNLALGTAKSWISAWSREGLVKTKPKQEVREPSDFDFIVERKDKREAAWDQIEVFTERSDAQRFLRTYVEARPDPTVKMSHGSYLDPNSEDRVLVRIRYVRREPAAVVAPAATVYPAAKRGKRMAGQKVKMIDRKSLGKYAGTEATIVTKTTDPAWPWSVRLFDGVVMSFDDWEFEKL